MEEKVVSPCGQGSLITPCGEGIPYFEAPVIDVEEETRFVKMAKIAIHECAQASASQYVQINMAYTMDPDREAEWWSTKQNVEQRLLHEQTASANLSQEAAQ